MTWRDEPILVPCSTQQYLKEACLESGNVRNPFWDPVQQNLPAYCMKAEAPCPKFGVIDWDVGLEVCVGIFDIALTVQRRNYLVQRIDEPDTAKSGTIRGRTIVALRC